MEMSLASIRYEAVRLTKLYLFNQKRQFTTNIWAVHNHIERKRFGKWKKCDRQKFIQTRYDVGKLSDAILLNIQRPHGTKSILNHVHEVFGNIF